MFAEVEAQTWLGKGLENILIWGKEMHFVKVRGTLLSMISIWLRLKEQSWLGLKQTNVDC